MESGHTITPSDGELPAVGDDAIEILENDHRAVKPLLTGLVEGSATQRLSVLEQLKAALTIHNATEENFVYPAIRDLANRPLHAGRLYGEQDEAKMALWELSQLEADDPDFDEKAIKLREAILAHVDNEERSEFPRLRESLDPLDLEKLTADVLAFRASLRFAPLPAT